MRWLVGLAPLVALLGCRVVPSEDELFDPDGDGVPWGEDCDNTDPRNACEGGDSAHTGSPPDSDSASPLDADGDGYPPGEDCDDGDAAVNPGANELCDAVDNDCDGRVDEGFAEVWHPDGDGDGFGDPEVSSGCPTPSGYVEDDSDCDDHDAARYPGADEVCGDGVVNNCRWEEGQAVDRCRPEGEVALEGAALTVLGDEDRGRLGFSLSLSADLTGDGVIDAVVGAPLASDAGLALVFDGSTSGVLGPGDAGAAWGGEAADDSAGYAVAAADVDGDGVGDLAVGAPFSSASETYAGASYLVSGPVAGAGGLSAADSRLYGADNSGKLGYSVALGDSTGDGCADWGVGAPGAAVAWLVVAPVDGSFTPSVADLSVIGAADSSLGQAVALGGDVDGDGVGELLVGAPNASPAALAGAGEAALVLGAAHAGALDAADADLLVEGSVEEQGLGAAVTLDGDLDGDGYVELVIGATGADLEGDGAEGAVLVVPGSGRGLSVEDAMTLTGQTAGDLAGQAVAVGDLDADGKGDLLVGAPGRDDGGDEVGVVYLVYGPVHDGIALGDADARLLGAAVGGRAGYAVDAAPGLGPSDLLVGAYNHDEGAAATGGAAWRLDGVRY